MREAPVKPPDSTESRATDWLASADLADPAAVAVAEVLEDIAGPPLVVVRGAETMGATELAEALQHHAATAQPGAPQAWVHAETGAVGRLVADVVVRLTHDPAARRADASCAPAAVPEIVAHPGKVQGKGITIGDVGADTAGVAELWAAVRDALALHRAQTRTARLRMGVAEVAAAFPEVRAGLEELLWPCA
ncbi:hypothetical protein KRX51_09050 [Corynebacterium sp. TAE3-ERU12]|uniref:hypothetical protein n=1 Tax=Corynebacterium sp. TAE3-ERU12 TaxID=2849491 RepID=UPI001C44601A|nr:hypothetical protein [Corynebacterium sp. TAE3-ERU12]MBV7296055.1 hypothetical protein [Corynebacterium sp. TAE3-ERU12]